MRLLLDTHAFLWFISKDPQLPAHIRDAVIAPENEVFLSVAAVWEVIVKHQLGKLALPQAPELYLPGRREAHNITSLEVDEASVLQVSKLPALHKDPFDRLMICQALAHGLTIATRDPSVRSYPVPTIW